MARWWTGSATEVERRVRDLLGRYGEAVAFGDIDLWATCWTPDARWRYTLPDGTGSDMDPSDFVRLRGADLCFQEVLSGRVALIPEASRRDVVATGSWLIRETCRRPPESAWIVVGRYDDEYVVSGDGLRFGSRSLVMVYRGDPAYTAAARTPDFAAEGIAR